MKKKIGEIVKIHNEISRLEKRGAYKKAASYLEKGIQLDPTNKEYKNRLIKLNEKFVEEEEAELRYENAMKYYEKLIQLDPNNPKYQDKVNEIKPKVEKQNYREAMKLEEQGKYEKAIICLNKAIKLNPHDTEYKNKLQKLQNKQRIGLKFKKVGITRNNDPDQSKTQPISEDYRYRRDLYG